eukprot:CAMPEP_0171247132 /NCGR_PEP_ID=MMETSP0790-20130122/48334_1 /TAXON_ID=2925 /ORGANISM="Alexandrium catenella, Strain OF101" /LENGTH=64 /DNA_ID=CAMNT_0011714525 /DNA_START=19 /DNA_END=210 /DNA_ORIENTATION=+
MSDACRGAKAGASVYTLRSNTSKLAGRKHPALLACGTTGATTQDSLNCVGRCLSTTVTDARMHG